jgi:hypothetical protein
MGENMSELSKKLDKIANNLESKGLIKEAQELDIISNTIEAFEKAAWDAYESPVGKVLREAIEAIFANNIPQALNFLKQKGKINKEMIYNSYKDIPISNGTFPARWFSDSYDSAIQLLQQNKTEDAKTAIRDAMRFLTDLAPVINEGYKKGIPTTPPAPAPQQTKPMSNPSGDMIFTKAKKPSLMSKLFK